MSKRKSTSKRTGSRGVKRLYRSGRQRMIGGVCGGIAEYFNTDPTAIRLLFVASFLLVWNILGPLVGVLAYIVAWIVIPRNPRHKW